MMSIERTNKYGAKLVCCERHLQIVLQNFFDHSPEKDRVVAMPCYRCEKERRKSEAPDRMKAALIDPRCVHTRWRSGPAGGYVTAYWVDSSSPTGVLAKASLGENEFEKVYEELIKEGKITPTRSPLSPTEGLLKGY